MVKLDYLEVKIVNYCNYKCRACSACANIAQRGEYNIDEFERDVKRISELLKIGVFRLMGGEPLLNKNIGAFLNIARKYLPDTDIRIVTNGSLISNMKQSFYDILIDDSVKVDISYYIGKEKKVLHKVDEGIKKLEDNKIPFEINKRKYFYLTMSKKLPNEDYNTIYRNYRNCRERLQCNNMFHGKIYPCIQSCSFQQYDEKFNTSFFQEDDGIDIYNPNITGEFILSSLEKPIGFCRNCAIFPSYFSWKEGIPLSNDWIMSLDNELYNNRISYYKYLIEDKKTEIYLVQVNTDNNINFTILNSHNFNEQKNFIKKPVYIWLESDNGYYHFDQFVNKVFLENNFIYEGIINNSFVQSLNCNDRIIDNRYMLYPCNIVFIPAIGYPFIQSLRNIKKELLQLKA